MTPSAKRQIAEVFTAIGDHAVNDVSRPSANGIMGGMDCEHERALERRPPDFAEYVREAAASRIWSALIKRTKTP
jgi:hypothetical protein